MYHFQKKNMAYFVYIIYSKSHDVFYKGVTTTISKRLEDHNNNLSVYTKNKGPWKIEFYRKFNSKKNALIYEKMLKKQNRQYLQWLINSDRNDLLD